MSRLDDARALVAEAGAIRRDTPLWRLLGELGTPYQTGSVVNGLMLKPDLDFEVQTDTPNFAKAVALVPKLVGELGAAIVKITDFSRKDDEAAYYFVGCDFEFNGRRWHVDATVTRPGELDHSTLDLLSGATDAQKEMILMLKDELMRTGRYAGAQAVRPYSFRSVHVYDGVMNGGVANITELEDYFKAK